MRQYLALLSLSPVLFLGFASAEAQDTRTVTQPTIPTVCSGHGGEITVTNGDLSSTDNTHFDTARIQSALNACPSGQAVELSVGLSYHGVSGNYNAFQLQPITIPAGVTLLIDSGVTVFASLNPRDYDVTSGSCGLVATGTATCTALIKIYSANGAGIMGAGSINGRGGDVMENTSPTTTWWNLKATATAAGLAYNSPTMVDISSSNSVTIYETHIVNAPHAHIVNHYCNGFTAWGITINTPYSAVNTDGLDIDNCQNVTVTQSTISDGDDNVAINSSGTLTATNYSITNNHMFAGHGVSIGSYTSAGVSNILVSDDSFSGNTSDSNSTGLRIKSAADRGGVINNIQYKNICIQNLHYPMQLNPHYNTNTGTAIPQFTNIGFHNVHVLTDGKVELEGYSSSYLATVTLDNVVFDSLSSSNITDADATITLGPGPVSSNLSSHLTGSGVTVHNNVTNSNAPSSCTNAFGTAP